MWTYLTILLSLSVGLGVFFRKLFLYKKSRKTPVEKVEPPLEEEDDVKESKKRISKNDRERVFELCEKGEQLIQQGKEDEAIKCFVQALAIDEKHLETLHKLAMLYLQKQVYSAAAVLFKQLGEMTGDAVHYSHLGLALYQQSAYEEAREAYQKAVVLDPGRPQRFASLSQVYRSMGQFNNAAVALNKALELDQKNIDFFCLLASLQIEMGQADVALETVNNILGMDGENAMAEELKKEIVHIKALKSLEQE